MTRRSAAALVALALAGPAWAQAPAAAKPAAPAAKPAAASPDFKDMMRKELDAWQTFDMKKVAPFFSTEPGIAFYDVAPLKYTGWAEYEAGFKDVAQQFQSIKFTMNDDTRVERHGDVAWGTTTAHAEVVDKAGKAQPLDVRWTVIWEKKPEGWKVVHEHVSAPLPEVAAAPASGAQK